MRFFRTAALALCLAALAASASHAMSYRFTRRTIHVAAHDVPLSFDAPEGMCFLDETQPKEQAAIENIRFKFHRKAQVLAAFADCLEIVNLGEKGSTGLQNGGWIGWFNPEVGEKAGMKRPDYLDMMEPTFAKWLSKDAETTRSETALKAGHIHDDEFIDGSKKATDVAATTTVMDLPLVFSVSFVEPKEAYPLDKAYAFMDNFVASALLKNGK